MREQIVKSMSHEESEYNIQIISLRHQLENYQEDIIRKSKDHEILQVNSAHNTYIIC